MRSVFVLALVTLATLAGCAARSQVETGKPSASAQQRVEELAQREAELQKQVDDLSNRIFLLEDKVDTSRVALERSKPAQLPVIRLKPRPAESEQRRDEADEGGEGEGGEDSSASAEPEEQERPATGGKSMVARRGVSYEGEARREGPRPVLRLHENGGGGSSGGGSSSGSSGSLASAGPDPASVSEKIPVVPIPKRSVGTQKASDVQTMREYTVRPRLS